MWFLETLSALGDLGKAIVSVIIVLILAGSAFLGLSFKLGLITGSFFLLLAAFIVALCSAWLHFQGNKIMAKMFLLGASVTMLSIIVPHYFPGASNGASAVAQRVDKKAQQSAERAVQEVPNKVRCDKSNYQRLVFFTTDGNTGEKRNTFWYARNNDDGSIECYDRPGFDPVFGKKLEAVDDNIVRQIVRQLPPGASVPTEPSQQPVQVAVATATPIPDSTSSPQAIPEPTPEPRRQFVAPAGQTFAVAINSMDLSKARENNQFTGTLSTDVLTKHGLVIAKSGSSAEVMITSLQLDQNTGNALLEMRVTALTTVNGAVLPVQASDHDAPIVVRPVKSGLRRNGIRGLAIGTVAGALAGAARDGKRGIFRGAGTGAVLGASAGALLTKGSHILPTGHLRVTLDEPWVVPATMIASN